MICNSIPPNIHYFNCEMKNNYYFQYHLQVKTTRENGWFALRLKGTAKDLPNRFPSSHNEKMISGLNTFIEACEERVQERIDRGVMGQLQK